jgi:hypothetical protein
VEVEHHKKGEAVSRSGVARLACHKPMNVTRLWRPSSTGIGPRCRRSVHRSGCMNEAKVSEGVEVLWRIGSVR